MAEAESYLNISDLHLKHRKPVCVFIISCHDLENERTRYGRRPKRQMTESAQFVLCNQKQKSMLYYCVRHSTNLDLT